MLTCQQLCVTAFQMGFFAAKSDRTFCRNALPGGRSIDIFFLQLLLLMISAGILTDGPTNQQAAQFRMQTQTKRKLESWAP